MTQANLSAGRVSLKRGKPTRPAQPPLITLLQGMIHNHAATSQASPDFHVGANPMPIAGGTVFGAPRVEHKVSDFSELGFAVSVEEL
jgi:hypothetical protein